MIAKKLEKIFRHIFINIDLLPHPLLFFLHSSHFTENKCEKSSTLTSAVWASTVWVALELFVERVSQLGRVNKNSTAFNPFKSKKS